MGSQKEDKFINKSKGILPIVPAIAGLYYFHCLSLHVDAFVIYPGFIRSKKLYSLVINVHANVCDSEKHFSY